MMVSTFRALSAFASLILVCAGTYAADTCALVARADVSQALGLPVGEGNSAAPQRDPDTGGQLSYCSFKTDTAALLVTVLEFDTPAEARKQFGARLAKPSGGTQVSEEAGIGEQAFWGVSPTGSAYTFLKSNKVIGVGVGGPGVADPAGRKPALRGLAMSLAGKN